MSNNANSICFEMAIDRMMMFSSGRALIAYDIAAVDAIKNGVTNQTISVSATTFANEAKNLPAGRAEKIKSILTGGFMTRLKMEVSKVNRQGVAA